jgi:hypothetical protein
MLFGVFEGGEKMFKRIEAQLILLGITVENIRPCPWRIVSSKILMI